MDDHWKSIWKQIKTLRIGNKLHCEKLMHPSHCSGRGWPVLRPVQSEQWCGWSLLPSAFLRRLAGPGCLPSAAGGWNRQTNFRVLLRSHGHLGAARCSKSHVPQQSSTDVSLSVPSSSRRSGTGTPTDTTRTGSGYTWWTHRHPPPHYSGYHLN